MTANEPPSGRRPPSSLKTMVTDREEQVDYLILLALRDFHTLGLIRSPELAMNQDRLEEALRIKSQCAPPSMKEIVARIKGVTELPKVERKMLTTLIHYYYTSAKFFRAIEERQTRPE